MEDVSLFSICEAFFVAAGGDDELFSGVIDQ